MLYDYMISLFMQAYAEQIEELLNSDEVVDYFQHGGMWSSRQVWAHALEREFVAFVEGDTTLRKYEKNQIVNFFYDYLDCN